MPPKKTKSIFLWDRLPSKETESEWILVFRKKGKYPLDSENYGKWLIFANIDEIDIILAIIKKATEEGKLGDCSKVATAKPSKNVANPDKKVICVYTYDWTDKEDVMRIREELRKLGITNKIPYKSSEDTSMGKYAVTGSKKISKYYE